MNYYVITFANTHTAITTQSHLESYAKITIMPTLREISAGCGISIRFLPDEFDHIIMGLNTLGLAKDMFKIYSILEENGRIVPSLYP